MRVDWLSLTSFRSYDSLEWRPDPGVNLLVGPNGAGKTNVLEAIAYLASLRSLRGTPDRSLIKDGATSAILRAGVSGEGRERLLEIELPAKGSRRTQVDKGRLRRTSDLLGVVRVVAFLPEDLDLIKRGPVYRRDLLDSIAVQLWPAAYLDQSEFDRALRQRNAFLKTGERDEATLSVWDSRLAQSGGRVISRRARVLESVGPYLNQAYREISQQDHGVDIEYVTSWGTGEIHQKTAADLSSEMTPAFEAARRADFERKVTTIGPHRDEPMFRIDEVEARTHGSQGEQRTIALAVKIAAHRAIADVVDAAPVLLLDDVFSELDPERSAALAKSLPSDTQTLITSARPEDVPIRGSMWRVDEGVHR
jgi:DNA replication and repair protein RecF